MKDKKIVTSDRAPRAIGPYSSAVISGDFIFTQGMMGLDPVTQELVTGGIEAETRQALTNLAEVLKAAGSSMDLALKTSVFLSDIKDFIKMNSVYGEFFPAEQPPARTAVQVAALPKSALVEIEIIARLNK